MSSLKEKAAALWNRLPTDWYGANLQKITTWLVVGFLVLIAVMLTLTEAEAAETRIELAPLMFVAGDRYNGGALFIEERWQGKYALGLGLTTEWKCPDLNDCRRGQGKTNQFVYAQRIIAYKKFEMGIGISYWHNTTPAWNSHTPFALHLGWNFSDRFGAKYRHFSTGGSSANNGGLDLPLTLSANWKF